MTNWKSMTGFLAFLLAYIHAVYTPYEHNVIETTGYFLLFAMLFVMMRSEDLTSIVKDLAEGLKERFKK